MLSVNTADMNWVQSGKGAYSSQPAVLTSKRTTAPNDNGYLSASEGTARNRKSPRSNIPSPLPTDRFGTLPESAVHQHAYIGPTLYDTRPDASLRPSPISTTPSPTSSRSNHSPSTGITTPDNNDSNWFDLAQAAFAQQKLSIRIAKVREFHAEAVEAEVKLLASLSKPLPSSHRGKVDVAAEAKREKEAIEEHMQAMRLLSARKDREGLEMIMREERKMIAGMDPSHEIAKAPAPTVRPIHNTSHGAKLPNTSVATVKSRNKHPVTIEEVIDDDGVDRSVNVLQEGSDYDGAIIVPATPPISHYTGSTSSPRNRTTHAPPIGSSPKHPMTDGTQSSLSHRQAGRVQPTPTYGQQQSPSSRMVGTSPLDRPTARPFVNVRATPDKNVRWTPSVVDRDEGYGVGRESRASASVTPSISPLASSGEHTRSPITHARSPPHRGSEGSPQREEAMRVEEEDQSLKAYRSFETAKKLLEEAEGALDEMKHEELVREKAEAMRYLRELEEREQQTRLKEEALKAEAERERNRKERAEAARREENARIRADEVKRRERDAVRKADEARRRFNEARRKEEQLALMEQEAEREREGALQAQQAAEYKLEELKVEELSRRSEGVSSRMEEEAKQRQRKRYWGFEDEARRAQFEQERLDQSAVDIQQLKKQRRRREEVQGKHAELERQQQSLQQRVRQAQDAMHRQY